MSKLLEQLKRHEGLRLKPYRCTAGKLTIGYGRNLDDVGISEREAEQLLAADIATAADQLMNRFNFVRSLDNTRLEVLINMVFNLGINRFSQFKKTIAYIEAGDYEAASIEMLDSPWATQVGSRATELSDQMRTGVYK